MEKRPKGREERLQSREEVPDLIDSGAEDDGSGRKAKDTPLRKGYKAARKSGMWFHLGINEVLNLMVVCFLRQGCDCLSTHKGFIDGSGVVG